jgi:expansin
MRCIDCAGWLVSALVFLACGGSGNGKADPKGTTGGAANATGGTTAATGGSSAAGASPVAGATSSSTSTYGDTHEGQYHLGPVDFAESEWHNACAPAGGYRSALRSATGLGGEYLAGVDNAYNANGGVCDACIQITTAGGRSIVARVVTYGVSNAPGDLDVSPSVYTALNTNEFPRSMSWKFAKCPDTGALSYEFQTEANIYWTSLWVRNPRIPISAVEVKSEKHATFFALRREGDGTLNDDNGFGNGAFTFRITGMDGSVVTDTLSGFSPGELKPTSAQFQ